MHRSILISVVFITACMANRATPPTLPLGADDSTRQRAYADNELAYQGGFWSHQWVRADGKYNLNTVTPTIERYPTAKRAHTRAKRRSLLVTILAATGGALIGTTLGTQLTATDDQKLPGTVAGSLYISGAALALIGIILDQTWAKPAYRDLATTYNAALREELRLAPLHPAAAAPQTSLRMR